MSDKNLPVQNIGMTEDEQKELYALLIEESTIKHLDSDVYHPRVEIEMSSVVEHVNTLFASRDATIARLNAQQITPEMRAVWDAWQIVQRDSISQSTAIRQSEDLRSELWHAFNAMMEKQEDDQ